MNDKAISVLRWIAVLPAAFLGMLIVRYLVEFSGKLSNYDMVEAIERTDGWGGYYVSGPIYLAIRQLLMAAAFMMLGCVVAPTQHRAVRIALAVLLGCILLSGVVVAAVVAHENNNVSAEFIVRDAVFVLSSAAGILYTFNVFSDKEVSQNT